MFQPPRLLAWQEYIPASLRSTFSKVKTFPFLDSLFCLRSSSWKEASGWCLYRRDTVASWSFVEQLMTKFWPRYPRMITGGWFRNSSGSVGKTKTHTEIGKLQRIITGNQDWSWSYQWWFCWHLIRLYYPFLPLKAAKKIFFIWDTCKFVIDCFTIRGVAIVGPFYLLLMLACETPKFAQRQTYRLSVTL